MTKFEESKFYKALQDFFINNNKDTFLQFLAEFYNRTESIIDKNIIQDDLIKELRELYIEFNEKGIDENIVREKVNYFLENSVKIKDILAKLVINTNKIEENTEKLNINTNNIENITSQLNNKVNKDEGGIITTAMLSQEVKESITGGSVAVVGKNAVLEENIVDNQVTVEKLDKTYSFGVVGKNKFDYKKAIHGRYLNTTNGTLSINDSYYTSDFIKLNKITTIYLNGFSPNQICFYDVNKTFTWSTINKLEITSNEGDFYFRFSTNTNELTNKLVEFDVKTGIFEEYKHVITEDFLSSELKSKLNPTNSISKNFVVVAKDGTGDFETITEAISYIDEGGTIRIRNGIYNEQIDTRNKEISIIGENKKKCIILSETGDYYSPPLEATCGYFENITFFVKDVGVAKDPLPYCVHIDFDYEVGKEIEFFNCDFLNEHHACIGMGTRKDFKAIFRNCNFTTTKLTATHGAFYFHDWEIGDVGTSNVVLDNCNIINKNSAGVMIIHDLGVDGVTTNVTFRNTCLYNFNTPTPNNFITFTGAKGSGFGGTKNFILTPDSYGNNISIMNN